MKTNMQVANTIRAQLGSRFVAMTGAKAFVGDERSLTFRIGANRTRANLVTVTLWGDDTYQVQTHGFRKSGCKLIGDRQGVYADNLARTIGEMTAMEVTL